MDMAGQHEYVTFDTGFRYNKCLALTAAGDAYFIGSGSALFPCVVHFNIHEKKVGNVCVCGVCAVLCVVLLVVCVCVCVYAYMYVRVHVYVSVVAFGHSVISYVISNQGTKTLEWQKYIGYQKNLKNLVC